jgi:hypothetical protein
MLKLIATSLLTMATMIAAAHASNTEQLEDCWSTAATSYLNRVGVSEQNLKEATQNADAACWTKLMMAGEAGREMREYMEVQLYNANKVDKAQPKIEKVSGFTPNVSYNLYNARTGFLCRFLSDVENARQLVDTNRANLVKQIGGCVVFDQAIEVEEIKRLYSAIEVRYVNAKGQMITGFTSDRIFRTKSGWNAIGIE